MTHPVRFGSAEIRPTERQLLIDGQPIPIGARAFDLLNVLITHRDRVVGKEELLQAVWPGLVVEENNLQVQISTLRKILGTGAISTITGLGYQFTAALNNDLATLPQVPRTAPPPSKDSSAAAITSLDRAAATPILGALRYRTLLTIAIGIVAMAGMILWIYLRARAEAPPVDSFRVLKAPPHSVAVLPFANMSGDPTQDYFSDGLSEELLDSLSSIPELNVAARTSSFTFKDKGVKIADVGRELNVGTVLEGSVRKDGQHVRINVQLVDIATGYDLWSHSYDREITNILEVQTQIAAAVTKALQARLLPNAAALIEMGGTQNPQAFDAYLQGEALAGRIDKEVVTARIAAYDEAIRQDPNFAKAYVGRAAALDAYAGSIALTSDVYFVQARAAAEKAVALAPELGRAHAALGHVLLFGFFDFAQSLQENERAVALSPGDSFVLRRSVRPLAYLGRTDSAMINAQRAVALDPINASSHASLGDALYLAQQYRQAIEAYERASRINSNLADVSSFLGLSHRKLAELDAGLKSCRTPPINMYSHVCLAVIYHDQGRTAEADAEMATIRGMLGDAGAFQYVEIYAQWNDVVSALRWLDTAYRLRDSGLVSLKIDELLDPLRSQPRFQEIERKLQFPN